MKRLNAAMGALICVYSSAEALKRIKAKKKLTESALLQVVPSKPFFNCFSHLC